MMKFSEEFRDESVRLVLESERTVAEVARDTGISVWTLRGRIQKRCEAVRSSLSQRRETLEQEIRCLRREVLVLRQEREILKKAAA